MFEFDLKTTKKIKVINVTEARGNFATLLSDTDSYYIITKNNKPQRVIIGFEEFRAWQKQLNSHEEIAPSLGDDSDRKTRVEPPLKENPVKGVLASRFEAVQEQAPDALESQESRPVSVDDFKPFESVEKRAEDVDDLAGRIRESAASGESADDYFFSDERTPADEGEELLPAPEAASTAEPSGYAQGFLEAQAPADDVAPPPQEDVALLSAEEADATPAPEALRHSAEEEAYFKRYSKLYESRPAYYPQEAPEVTPEELWAVAEKTAAAQEGEPEIATPDDGTTPATSDFEATPGDFFSEPPVDKDSPSVPDASARADALNDSFVMSRVTDEEREELARLSPPKPAPAQEPETLPSLQELLRDLEKEKLSGEEGDPLGQEEIDDIINRITSD